MTLAQCHVIFYLHNILMILSTEYNIQMYNMGLCDKLAKKIMAEKNLKVCMVDMIVTLLKKHPIVY